VTICECPVAYLVVLEKDGAYFPNGGTLEAMAELNDRLDGPGQALLDDNGIFVDKERAP